MASNYRSPYRDLPVEDQQNGDWGTKSSASHMQTEFFAQEEFGQQSLPLNTTGSFSGTFPSSATPASQTPLLTISPYAEPNSSFPYRSNSSPVSPQHGHMIPGRSDPYGNGMEYGSAPNRNENFGHNSAL
jgi:hypothetical protein